MIEKILSSFEKEQLSHLELDQLHKRISKVSHLPLKRFLTLALVSQSQNDAWLRALMKEYIQGGVKAQWFHHKRISRKEHLLLEKLTNTFLKRIDKKEEIDSTLKQIFKEQLRSYQYQSFMEGRKEQASSFSLQELRNLLKNPRYHLDYFSFFYTELLGRVTRREELKVLADVLRNYSLSSISLRQWWVFQGFLPGDKALRDKLIEGYRELWNSKDPFLRSIVVDASTVQAIKKEMEKVDPLFKRAHFQISREFYRRILKEQPAHEWAFFSLSKLGEEPEGFWLSSH